MNHSHQTRGFQIGSPSITPLQPAIKHPDLYHYKDHLSQDPFHFSYLNHPIYNDPYFVHSTVSSHPVIMSHYYRHVPSIEYRRNDGIVLAFGVASSHTLASSTEKPVPSPSRAATGVTASAQMFQNLDALVVPGFDAPPSKSPTNPGGVEAHPTSVARVFVLLYGNGTN